MRIVERGSEDLVLLSNGIVLISSGMYMPIISPDKQTPGKIFMYDPSNEQSKAEPLTIKGGQGWKPEDFFPLGMTWWEEKGTTTLYVINSLTHAIDIFEVKLAEKQLIYKKSVSHPSISNPNSLIAIGHDQFYISNFVHFSHPAGFALEMAVKLPLGTVWFHDGSNFVQVLGSLKGPNGIAVSKSKKLLYLATNMDEQLRVYRIQPTPTNLTLVSSISLYTGVDNVKVDSHGAVWIGAHPILYRMFMSLMDPKKNSMPSQVLKITFNEDHTSWKVEEIYADDGDQLSGSTTGLLTSDGKKLVIGSALHKALVCQMNQSPQGELESGDSSPTSDDSVGYPDGYEDHCQTDNSDDDQDNDVAIRSRFMSEAAWLLTERFLSKSAQLHQEIHLLDSYVEDVKLKHSQLLVSPHEDKKTKNELDAVMEAFNQLSRKVRKIVKEMESEFERVKTQRSVAADQAVQKPLVDRTRADDRIRENQLASLNRRLLKVLTAYNEEQVRYRDLCRNRIKSYIDLTGKPINEDELDEIIESGNLYQRMGGLFMDQGKAKQVLQDIEARHSDIIRLESSIKELHHMFQDMVLLLEEQGEKIDHIEFNVELAVDYTQKATRQIKSAVAHRDRYKRKKMVLIAICVVIILVILIIVVTSICSNFSCGGSSSKSDITRSNEIGITSTPL